MVQIILITSGKKFFQEVNMNNIIKKITFVLFVICWVVCISLIYYSAKLPDSYYRRADSGSEISFSTALKITASSSDKLSLTSASSTVPATSSMTLRLMGIIPIKQVAVQNIDVPMLAPCGKPFGIKLIMDGVMIIKTGGIVTSSGIVSPAADAGIQTGDIIKSINDIPVYSNSDIEKRVSELSDKKINIKVMRNGNEMTLETYPAYSEDEKAYKLGIWVRDSSAGIGTVTYYDDDTGTFGGLGHPVCDSDTGQILPLSSGEVVNVSIRNVKKGKCGVPGELQGYFTKLSPCGKLYLNNKFGVFGTIDNSFSGLDEIPMALKQEIRTGDAVIYSTLDGCEPEKFDIEIEEINYNCDDTSKNMVIKITDPELIARTGGIVQGMSGSPIIQNDMIVGAVTHVFVNDPTKGYAIFCESMYEMSRTS